MGLADGIGRWDWPMGLVDGIAVNPNGILSHSPRVAAVTPLPRGNSCRSIANPIGVASAPTFLPTYHTTPVGL